MYHVMKANYISFFLIVTIDKASNLPLLAVNVFQDHPRKMKIRKITTKYLLYYLRII